MRRSLVTSWSLALLAAAAPAFGGAVYVPYTADITVGNIRYETQVWAANRGSENRRFSTVFINAGSDGTNRQGVVPTVRTVVTGSSVLVQDLAGANQLGMLEIAGAPQIAVSARIVPVGGEAGSLGGTLPVISSESLIPAGTTVHLQGLARDGQKITDLVLANVDHSQASCSVSTIGANGAELGTTAQVTIAPLSVNRFADVLATLNPPQVSGVRTVVSCNKTFYAFALTFDSVNAGVKVIEPSAPLTSTLS